MAVPLTIPNTGQFFDILILNMPERLLQIDMFSGELVDTRTREQRQQDRVRNLPAQLLMFSQRDMAQIGVSPTPRMDLSPGRLVLIAEDPRTDEEKERDLQRQARADGTFMIALKQSIHFIGRAPQCASKIF